MPRPKKKKNRPAGGGGNGGLDKKELASQYGWALATLKSNKELWNLFNRAVNKNLTPARFVAELRDTKWFQTQSESQRKYVVLKTSDPAQYKAIIKQRMASITNMWGQMGGSTPSQNTLAKIADASLKLGWNDEQIGEHVSNSINWKQNIQKNTLRGNAASNMNQLKKMSSQYGVTVSNDWYANALEAVAGDDATLEGYQNNFKEMAKKRYSQFADELDSGMTMHDVIEPYKQSMANILELNPGQIDLKDSQIRSMLSYRVADKKGVGVPGQMSLTEFEDKLRQDSRWQYTQNARDKGMAVVDNLVTRWGLKG